MTQSKRTDHEERSEQQKERAQRAIATVRDELIALSEWLHANPELAWQEHRSSQRVCDTLAENSFDVETNYLGLETAFHASFGTGKTRIGLCAEYDALPQIGHACGHNLISAMTVGAAIALSHVADELEITVEVFGTPAEEGGGGKIELIDRGAFHGLDLAMMAHPAPVDAIEARPYAVSHSRITYHGKAAHAAAYPEYGTNAADAFTIAQVALGLLRQQLPQSVRIHGVLTNGGEAPNAIPEVTQGRWYVRARDLQELAEIERRVWKCFEAGALATGCRIKIEPESKPYAEFTADGNALRAYEENARTLGRNLSPSPDAQTMNRASTDMGNVSQIVPAIHPYIGVDSFPVLNHQREFANYCVGRIANKTLVDGATALAWTGIDIAMQKA